MFDFLQQNSTILLAIALGVSELLAAIPALKSNSILGLVINTLKSFAGKKDTGELK